MGRINYQAIALSIAGAEKISTVKDINEDDFILIPNSDYGFVLRQVTRLRDFLYAGNVDLRSVSEPEDNYNEPEWIVRIKPEFEYVSVQVSQLTLNDLGLGVKFVDSDGKSHEGTLTALGKECLFIDDKKVLVGRLSIITVDRD